MSEPMDKLAEALAERDRYAGVCPLDKRVISAADHEQCSVCGATRGENCGRKVTADWLFVENARAIIANLSAECSQASEAVLKGEG